jgi:hypothetical protein
VTLVLSKPAESYELTVESRFTYGNPSDLAVLDPALPPETLYPVLHLARHAHTVSAVIRDQTHLAISFNDGKVLLVEPSSEGEAWQIAGPNGYLLVSSPGGELIEWSGEEPHSASEVAEPD